MPWTPSPGPTSSNQGRPTSTEWPFIATLRRTVACPTFTVSTGWCASPPAWPQGSRACGGSTTTAPSRPNSWTLWSHRTLTWSPSTPTSITRRWRPSARSARRRCFHPAAHDEPALYLPVFRGTFGDADAFCFYTASERALVERMYHVAERPQIVLGLGVGELPGCRAARCRRPRSGGSALHRLRRTGSTNTKAPKCWPRSSPPTSSATRDRLALALVGPVSVDLPPHPDIVVTGTVSEADKWDIMRDALVAVSPSALESFSLVVIEAWVDEVPVLVNGTCGPTREHCERSGGGLWFTSYPEFEATLDRLVCDASLRAELGHARAALSWTGISDGRCWWTATTSSSRRWWRGDGAPPACSDAGGRCGDVRSEGGSIEHRVRASIDRTSSDGMGRAKRQSGRRPAPRVGATAVAPARRSIASATVRCDSSWWIGAS